MAAPVNRVFQGPRYYLSGYTKQIYFDDARANLFNHKLYASESLTNLLYILRDLNTSLNGLATGNDKDATGLKRYQEALTDAADLALLGGYMTMVPLKVFSDMLKSEVTHSEAKATELKANIDAITSVSSAATKALEDQKDPDALKTAADLVLTAIKAAENTATGFAAEKLESWRENMTKALNLANWATASTLQDAIKRAASESKGGLDVMGRKFTKAAEGAAALRLAYEAFDKTYKLVIAQLVLTRSHLEKSANDSVKKAFDYVDGWYHAKPTDALSHIPRLGLVELLVRVVAQGCNSTGELATKLNDLKLKTGNTAERDFYACLPVVLFVCVGRWKTNDAKGPTFVITTSTDHWDWSAPMNKIALASHSWKKDGEMKRPAVADLDPNPFDVDGRSADASKEFWAVGDDFGLRKQEIRNWKTFGAEWQPTKSGGSGTPNARWCNHKDEMSSPFSCPSFTQKARCVRCQHLFEYWVDQSVIREESLLLGQQKPSFNMGWSCAETHAHFYCLAARAAAATVGAQVNH